MSEQPYKLGDAKTVGGAAGKAAADIGASISQGIEAVTGLKKHRANLEHIATQTQLGHERMLEAMSHADSLAAQAKERGQDISVKADHSSVEYESRSVKEPKSTKEKVVDAAIDVAKSAVTGGTVRDAAVGAMRSFVETKKARGITGGPKAPKSGVAEKKSRVTEPTSTVASGSATAPTSSASDKMKDFNAKKKARGITSGSKVAATAARTRSAKNAANPKIYPAGVKSTPEQVRVNVARAWQDKKKTMRASKGAN